MASHSPSSLLHQANCTSVTGDLKYTTGGRAYMCDIVQLV